MNALETRIPPPLLMIVTGAVMWFVAGHTLVLHVSAPLRQGLAFALLAAAIFYTLLAVLLFRRHKTTINPHSIGKASKLVTSGPFSLSRNPMYTGMVLLLLAWTCYLASPWAVLGPIFFELYILRFQIWPEERAMHAKFGADYVAYAGKVRRWL